MTSVGANDRSALHEVKSVGASSLRRYLLAGILLTPPAIRLALAPVWVALLWAYCILDHVDGCRARRRGASSPWGECLDHGRDDWDGTVAGLGVAVVPGPAGHRHTRAATPA